MDQFSLEQQALLMLLDQCLWKKPNNLPEQLDWDMLKTLSAQQGVLALAYDGAVAGNASMPAELKKIWSQQTILAVMKNERLLVAQDQLLEQLQQANIPAVILKGSSVAQYYPQPDLRALGDIDVLVPRESLEQVKAILLQSGYEFREADHDFHLGFSRPGAYVEVHYDVTTLPQCRGGDMAKQEIRRFLECREQGSMGGHGFPMLSQQHQALMLLLHMVRHTLDSGIGLRQLCDWAMYVATVDPEKWKDGIVPMLQRCGLLRYAQVATAACLRYLGLPERYAAWCEAVTQEDARRFMQDLFLGGNMGRANPEKIGRLLTSGGVQGDNRSLVKVSLAGLSAYAMQRYPVAKKHKWLLPFFWIYMPARYWLRSLFGLRKKKSVSQALKDAKTQQSFLEMLDLFETDDQ